jgi:hypothetical protein
MAGAGLHLEVKVEDAELRAKLAQLIRSLPSCSAGATAGPARRKRSISRRHCRAVGPLSPGYLMR